MFKLTFQPNDITIEAEAGELLADVAARAGIPLALPCGSQGRCGRCLVRVERGTVGRRESAQLSAEQVAIGWALACRAEVDGDATIVVPPQRLGERLVAEKSSNGRSHLPKPTVALDPAVRKVYLALPTPTLEDPLNDLDRLRRALEVAGAPEPVSVGLDVLRGLAGALRAANWDVTATLAREGTGWTLIDVAPGDTSSRQFGVCVDIGTTTVVAAVIDLRTGDALASVGEYNDQIAGGEDVISRIIYARTREGAGLRHLQQLGIRTINRVVAAASERAGVAPEEIVDVVVAGNTTMCHIFLGLDPQSIRLEPYTPTANDYPVVTAAEVGLTPDSRHPLDESGAGTVGSVHPRARVWTLPSVASFVGGDITAGVVASETDRAEALTLFLDVGTNGELVLGNADWLMTCACSAGPAFEGAGVRCGMRATTGAIEDVTIDRATLEPTLRVIGNVAPVGVCGSGMIAALAELFLAGVCDKVGAIDVGEVASPLPVEGRGAGGVRSGRLRRGPRGAEYVLAFADETATGEDVVLAEADLGNLIRAKGAIYAGITSLVRNVGLDVADVERVLIGGSFGQHIDVRRAITIGLLPDLPVERFRFLGNTSLQGAHACLISQQTRARASEAAHRMTYLELIADSAYMDEYTSALFLPHTDADSFPTVRSALESSRAGVV